MASIHCACHIFPLPGRCSAEPATRLALAPAVAVPLCLRHVWLPGFSSAVPARCLEVGKTKSPSREEGGGEAGRKGEELLHHAFVILPTPHALV